MPLRLSPVMTGAVLLGASTWMVGCQRSGARSEQSSHSAAVPDSSSASQPSASLPQQIADELVLLNGGVHTGFRFNHAKGIVVSGSFTPTAQAKTLSRAAHFSGPTVPVTVRFSNASGVPANADNDPQSGPRGMAIRFNLPDKGFTDIVSISHNGFVVGTGEDFLAFFKAIAASGPDASHPSPIETFFGSHPLAAKFAMDVQARPKSYATAAYFGNNAFVFVNGQGKRQPVRYQIIPAAGVVNLDSAAASKQGANYLQEELQRRLTKEPVQFRLFAQLPNQGDPTKD